MRRCPVCDREMEHQPDDPDVGIVGGWYCSYYDKDFPEDDHDEDE